jgi:hypothetical protein
MAEQQVYMRPYRPYCDWGSCTAYATWEVWDNHPHTTLRRFCKRHAVATKKRLERERGD